MTLPKNKGISKNFCSLDPIYLPLPIQAMASPELLSYVYCQQLSDTRCSHRFTWCNTLPQILSAFNTSHNLCIIVSADTFVSKLTWFLQTINNHQSRYITFNADFAHKTTKMWCWSCPADQLVNIILLVRSWYCGKLFQKYFQLPSSSIPAFIHLSRSRVANCIFNTHQGFLFLQFFPKLRDIPL